jgi:transcriptional regulator with XRE-family HTH domain
MKYSTIALRIAMQAAGISQAALARELGCSRAWVHDVLNGRVRPSPNFVRDVPLILADRLGSTADELRPLLFGEEVDESTPSVLGRRLTSTGDA